MVAPNESRGQNMTDAARILVVDDDRVVRQSVARVLAQEGHQVDQAGSGAEAVQVLEAGRYALVILDLRMPRLGGLTVLQHVRHRHPEIPVLVMTGFPTLENAKESIQLGAFEFLQKPLDAAQIRTVVARALDSGSLTNGQRC